MFQYPWLLAAVTLAAGISFVDDIHSLPDSVRLVAQFAAMGLLLTQLVLDNGQLTMSWWGWALAGIVALIVMVGATNIYNFMDGINGITAGYSLAVLIPLFLLNRMSDVTGTFVDGSLIVVTIMSVLVFLLVYGIDGCCTILHRIMLHENLGEAHRKHAYQLMANELKMGHVTVSLIYFGLQLVISLVMVYLIPNTVLAHWIYLVVVAIVLALAYLLFMKKYYHLHEEYLESLKTK